MCGCGGNINREVITSAQIAAEAALREAAARDAAEASRQSVQAALSNAGSR
jgi:hypothetical protein